MQATRRAMTIIEVMVVVTIIVILLAFMMPALDRAMEAAQRAVCASHLHAFGAAHSSYGVENGRMLLTVPRHYKPTQGENGSGWPYGWLPWLYRDNDPGELSAEAIRPYIGESMGQRIKGLWLCPSSQMETYRAWNEAYYDAPRGQAPEGTNDDGPYFYSEYSYLGGVGALGTKFSTRPDQLSDGRLGSSGCLMVDNVFHSNLWLLFNHGAYERAAGAPTIEGMNRLMGDNSAHWLGFSRARSDAVSDFGPRNALGDFMSSLGMADRTNSANDDGYTLY